VLAFVVIFGVLSTALKGEFSDTFKVPGVESQKAIDLLDKQFKSESGDTATLVFHVNAPAKVTDSAVQAQIQTLLDTAAGLPHVAVVRSPIDRPFQISADGQTAYAEVGYDAPANEIKNADINKLIDAADAANGNGLQVEAGGQIVAQAEAQQPGASELIGVTAAALILLIAFGSVVAMGLPVVTALIGLLLGFMAVGVFARFMDIPTFTPAFASMIGIGVGIDYALFIVTRFREGLKEGLEPSLAVERAMDTAGRAVIFAGGVVVISMLGLLAIGIPFVSALGIAAAVVVGSAIAVALVVLPALLALIHTRIDPGASMSPAKRPKSRASRLAAN